MPYRCSVCDELHDDLPDIASDRPDQYWGVPEHERERRVELTAETCIIDGEDHFVRGVLDLPIHDQDEPFGFGVWVSQKRENFLKYQEQPDTSAIGPFFGWLCTRIDYYPITTLLLKARVHFRDGKQRPRVELEPTDHPLAVAQRAGITLQEAWEIVHHYQDKS